MRTKERLLRVIAAILLPLLSVVPLCIPHAPVSALDLLSVSFERTNETPVSVDFRVTVINNGPDDINNIPLNILFSGIDQSQIREVTVNSVSKVTAVREEPIIESVEKRYKPEGRVELSTDSEGNTYFTDIVLSKGGNKITLGIGEIVEGDIVQSGQYEKYDESTGEYIWHEDEVVGTKEIPYLVESKALLHDFKVTPNSKLTTSFSQPSISHNDYGTGNGVRVFDVTINTGEQTNGKGWGSKGLMIWDVDGIKFYDNQHSSWWDNSWKYRQQLKFNNATISENLIDFPVGIFLNNTNFDFSQAQAAGQDIRFVDADGTTPLKYEIVSWDGSSAEIYVKVPQIDSFSNSDYIFMYWGNSSCADGSDKTNVWDSHYVAVYHMNDASTTTIADSTSNANTGTKKAIGEPVEVTGTVGKAQSFDGANDYVDCGNGASLNITEAITLEAWVKYNTQKNFQVVVGKGNSYWVIQKYSGENGFYSRLMDIDGGLTYATGANTLSAGQWIHVAATWAKGGYFYIFYNGVQKGISASILNKAIKVESTSAKIGYNEAVVQYFNGLISEVRISSVARSAGWIAATNLSLRNQYVTFATESSATPSILLNTILQVVLAVGVSVAALSLIMRNSVNLGSVLVVVITGIITYILVGSLLQAFPI